MEILVDPNSTRSIINRHGALGVEWVENLPQQLERLAQKWNLVDWQAVAGSVTACIFFATQNGNPVVIKTAPDHPRLAKEALALQQWLPSGLVPGVIDQEPGCYLMSRIIPGTAWQGDDEKVFQALRILGSQDTRRCNGIITADEQLITRLSRLQMQQAGYEMGVTSQDFIAARNLISQAPESGLPFQLLHTDLHPQALLNGQGDLPQLVDPSPAWGPAAWDLAAWIAKSGGPNMESRIIAGSDYLGYSTEYVRQIARAVAIEGAAVTARYGLASQAQVDELLAWGRGG